MSVLEWVQHSEIVRNYGIVAAGVVGLVLGGMRVVAANRQANAQLKQAELSRREHVAELFNRAVGQLDDPKLQVRLGAIYMLRQIRGDFPDLAEMATGLLTAYLRESTHDYGDGEPPADVKEIIEMLRTRPETRE